MGMFRTKQSKHAGGGCLEGALLLLCAVGIGGAYSNCAFAAGFATNFKPELSSWGSSPTTGYCTFGQCTSQQLIGNSDPTPFGESIVNIGGVNYFHVIVGDPGTGFAMESYTRANGLDALNGIDSTGLSFSQDGGGMERQVIGTGSAIDPTFFQDASNSSNVFGVSGNPNPHVTGTGTQDPNYVVFRMVLNDPSGDMSLEVYKPFLDKKPRISQTVQDVQDFPGVGTSTLSGVFVADERALGYSDISTPAPVVNNLRIVDTRPPSEGGFPDQAAADFEMALAQVPDITAGRYTYTAGTKWNTSSGWNVAGSTFDTGDYSYIDAQGFNPLTFDWTTVFNYTDNTLECSTGDPGYIRQDRGVYGGSCPGHP